MVLVGGRLELQDQRVVGEERYIKSRTWSRVWVERGAADLDAYG